MKRWIAIVALVGAGACGNKKDDGKTEERRSPPPELAVKYRGKVVPMTSAVAVRWQDDSIHVLVANNDVPCAQALGSARVNVPRDDVSFSAGVSRRLAPDGTWSWELTSYSTEQAPEEGELAPAQVSADGREVAFTYKDVRGTVVATPCGDRPIEKDHPAIAKAPHASTATITIAGQKAPIVSAWQFEKETYLSTEPITCAYAGLPTRATLILDDRTWKLAGGWLATEHDGDGAGLAIEPGARGDSPDGPTVSLSLSGKTTIDGYAVELSGTIEALACKSRG